MARADFVIVRVMCRRDLNGPSTELHVDDDVVCDNGDAAVKERVFRKLAVQVRVTRVIGMDSNRSIAEHGLRTSSCDNYPLVYIQKFELVDFGIEYGTYQNSLLGMRMK